MNLTKKSEEYEKEINCRLRKVTKVLEKEDVKEDETEVSVYEYSEEDESNKEYERLSDDEFKHDNPVERCCQSFKEM